MAGAVAVVLMWLLAGFEPAAAAAPARPSVLFVVIDTLRASAVSAYGETPGTTPALDALAAQGLRYEHAYASAPWTLPTHATIFSGLPPDQHRVAMPGRAKLPESIVTLAERMQAAGYQTAALSENLVVSDIFQMLQGFEYRRTQHWRRKAVIGNAGNPMELQNIDSLAELRTWLERERDPSRPFFLFLNLFDPHAPYQVRERNPFVPEGTPASLIKARSEFPHRLICAALPGPQELAVLRGLYLGDVAAADSKLGKLVELVQERAGAGDLITIVTADHGEFLGERKLLGHEFGLHGSVLHVPLVVHGLRGVPPSVIGQPVTQIDIAPSVLRWAGIDVPPELPGQPLPQAPGDSNGGERSLLAAYSDEYISLPGEWGGNLTNESKEKIRQFCGPSDRVFGGMATLIRYPFKFYWFERYSPELYDLSWDPNEISNQAAHQAKMVEHFRSEIESQVRAAALDGSATERPEELSDEGLEALKALGYID